MYAQWNTIPRFAGHLLCPRCTRRHCRVLVADQDGLCCKRCRTYSDRGWRWDALDGHWWRVEGN
jgi:hypothetical protein